VLYYYLSDHVLFLAYKLARKDLYHWVPLEGAGTVVQSVCTRVVLKAITDFTGVVQFRVPGEMDAGGWMWSQLTALATSFVATHIYLSRTEAAADLRNDEVVEDQEVISESVVWTIVGGLSTGFVISFTSFLLLMKRKYVPAKRGDRASTMCERLQPVSHHPVWVWGMRKSAAEHTAGGVRGVSPRQPEFLPASAAEAQLQLGHFASSLLPRRKSPSPHSSPFARSRRYVTTFFSTQTGYASAQSYFVSRQTDEEKRLIFKRNKKQWTSIRSDVKAWTLENWERWEEERPAWFNDAFKAAVDDDMIPPESIKKMDWHRGSRRRSSLGDLLGGTGRVAPVAGRELQQ
jgi:hypothetical protein